MRSSGTLSPSPRRLAAGVAVRAPEDRLSRARPDVGPPGDRTAPPTETGSACPAPSHPTSEAGHNPASRQVAVLAMVSRAGDRKSTRLNSSHANISYAVFCLKKKKTNKIDIKRT